jgi:hypothetical protein
MDILNKDLHSDKSLLGAAVQVLDLDIGFSLLFGDFFFLFVTDSFFGDLVEEAEDDGGEDEPERDEGVLGVAKLNILSELGKVLEAHLWSRRSQKWSAIDNLASIFSMVHFAVLSEVGKVLEGWGVGAEHAVIDSFDFSVLIEPGEVLKGREFTQHATTAGESSTITVGDNLLGKLSSGGWVDALGDEVGSDLSLLGGFLSFRKLWSTLWWLRSLGSSSSNN